MIFLFLISKMIVLMSEKCPMYIKYAHRKENSYT